MNAERRASGCMAALLFVLFSATCSLAAEPPITALAVTPDGKAIVVGSQASVRIYSYPDLLPGDFLGCEFGHVHDLAFSPKGDLLAIAGGKPGEEGAVELLSWPGMKRVAIARPHRDLVYRVAWRGDGSAIWTASADRESVLLDDKLAPRQRLSGHSRGLLAVEVLPDGSPITASLDQSIRLWDLPKSKPRRVFDQHTDAVSALALRPGDHGQVWLASASADKTVRFWQPAIGRLVRFARLPSEPLAIAWLRDGSHVVAACVDGKVYAIDPDTAEVSPPRDALAGWAYSIVAAPEKNAVIVGGEGGKLVRVELQSR